MATNAFTWHGRPSIFAGDPQFQARGKAGRTLSQSATVASDTARAKNPSHGTVRGISRAEKVLADKWQGSVSKAGRSS